MATSSTEWDPSTASVDQPSKEAIRRICDEQKDFGEECPLPYVYVYFDEEDITKVHVLMVGEIYTPYEGGFFYFLIRFPANYPREPPKVKLMNTGGGRVRFNPNIYNTGMVCHGMLGTWGEKAWKPEFRLMKVLAEIQSMLQERPFEKEPFGPPGEPFPEIPGNDMSKYDEVIRHETLRVAVCDMMEGQVDMPEEIRGEMKKIFKEKYKAYRKTCENNGHLNDIALNEHDPFSKLTVPVWVLFQFQFDLNRSQSREGTFDYAKILERLEKIKETLDKDLQ